MSILVSARGGGDDWDEVAFDRRVEACVEAYVEACVDVCFDRRVEACVDVCRERREGLDVCLEWRVDAVLGIDVIVMNDNVVVK